MGFRQMAVRVGSGLRTRALLGGLAALVATVPLLAVVPAAAAQTAEPPVAVDVDLVEGGVWVTYSNGCVESRAWQLPFGDAENWWAAGGNRQCVASARTNGPDSHRPRIIRAPLALARGERAVALVPTAGQSGYWLITSAGRVVTGGSARSLGDLSAFTLNAPVVAAAPTASGEGYYMLSADGGVFTFGDAKFYGSVQGLVDEHVGFGSLAVDHLTAPIVTLATTPAGYWLVAADGAVFPFGDAAYHGSIQDAINLSNQLAGVTRDWVLTPPQAPGTPLARDALSEPVIGVVPSGGGAGYQMVAADGGIFNFGVSQFHGSLAGRAESPAVASDVTNSRSGYVILTEEGRVHRFGVIGRQVDPAGNSNSQSLPTALPVSECRPQGVQGFPLRQDSTQTVGALNVGVLFVEFDEYPADRDRWPKEVLAQQLHTAEHYLETMSYGQLDAEFDTSYEWISLGAFREEYQGARLGSWVAIVTDDLRNEVLSRADDLFDFSNRGLGYETIAVVFPPSWFGGGLAHRSVGETVDGVTIDAVAWTNTVTHSSRRADRWPWWTTLAHELMHMPGLDDLYDYGTASNAVPDGQRVTQFGLMRLPTTWPVSQQVRQKRGQLTFTDGSRLVDEYLTLPQQRALEMVAWHRWRLGWLQDHQIHCLSSGDVTFDIASIAKPGDGVTMAAMKLSDTQFLVFERRERVGYDADQQGHNADNSTYYYRVLSDEGVLAYVVDVTVENGQVPMRPFGEDQRLPTDKSWILQAGDSRTATVANGTSVHVAITEGPNGTSRVQITTS